MYSRCPVNNNNNNSSSKLSSGVAAVSKLGYDEDWGGYYVSWLGLTHARGMPWKFPLSTVSTNERTPPWKLRTDATSKQGYSQATGFSLESQGKWNFQFSTQVQHNNISTAGHGNPPLLNFWLQHGIPWKFTSSFLGNLWLSWNAIMVVRSWISDPSVECSAERHHHGTSADLPAPWTTSMMAFTACFMELIVNNVGHALCQPPEISVHATEPPLSLMTAFSLFQVADDPSTDVLWASK